MNECLSGGHQIEEAVEAPLGFSVSLDQQSLIKNVIKFYLIATTTKELLP